MVALSTVRASNTLLKDRVDPLTAIFAGGTAGIGEEALKAFAVNAKAPNVYLVGRNEEAAKLIIDGCLKSCPEGNFHFLKADLSLLKNVDEVCEEVLRREKKLDLLFMSQGYLTFEGRLGGSASSPLRITIHSCLFVSAVGSCILNLPCAQRHKKALIPCSLFATTVACVSSMD